MCVCVCVRDMDEGRRKLGLIKISCRVQYNLYEVAFMMEPNLQTKIDCVINEEQKMSSFYFLSQKRLNGKKVTD